MTKAIFFDLDDTLHDSRQPFLRAMKHVFPDQYDVIPVYEVYKMFRHISDLLWNEYSQNNLTLEELRMERIIRTMKYYSVAILSDKAKQFQAQYDSELKSIKLFSDAPAVLTALREMGFVLGIITNGPTRHQANKIQLLGLSQYIESSHIFISDEVGIAKPDVGIFHFAAHQTQHHPNELLYIGDSWENDVAAPIRSGWQSIWYNHRRRERQTHHEPLAEIQQLSSMLHMLKQLT